MNDIKTFVKTKTFKTILWIVGGLLIILISFAAGIRVGLHKARYSYQWGANYERNFIGGPRGMMNGGQRGFNGGPEGMMNGFQGKDFRNGHGVAGIIASISDNNIIIKDNSGKENTVAVSDKTIIKNGNQDIKITDLKNDENIVVMGNPGDKGVVNADLIRVFDNNYNPQN